MINRRSALLTSALTILGLSLSFGCAEADIFHGKCLLQVGGEMYINGTCEVEMSTDGGFTISSLSKKDLFATVFTPEGDTAEGNWTGTGSGNIAERFDTLHRHGACWTNASTKVCAYR